MTDSAVSGGKYILSGLESGTATYSFNVDKVGSYEIFGRIYADNAGTDSLYFTIDNLAEDIWDFSPAVAASDFNVWRDDAITKRGAGDTTKPEFDPYLVSLTAGSHTFTLRGREAGAKLDYFYLVQAGQCVNADINCDGCVKQDELMQYIQQWKAGSVTLTNLMEAISQWKKGC
jgi:hypothetical protein